MLVCCTCWTVLGISCNNVGRCWTRVARSVLIYKHFLKRCLEALDIFFEKCSLELAQSLAVHYNE